MPFLLFFSDLGAVLTCFFDDFCNFSKTAVLLKIAPRLHASSIFRVWRVREQSVFVFVRWLVSGLVWESFFSDFWMDLGSVLATKIDKKRHRFRD